MASKYMEINHFHHNYMSNPRKNWDYKYGSDPKLYFGLEERIYSSLIWNHFILYMQNKIENFEKYAPRLRKVRIDFMSNKIDNEQYIFCKFLCESSQIRDLCIKFTNIGIYKKKNLVKILLPHYMIEDKKISNQILSNLPINTNIITYVFTHKNLPPFCWIHNKPNCKISNILCHVTNSTMIFDSTYFLNLPLSVTEIRVNACIDNNNMSIIFDKCKLPLNVNLVLNLKSNNRGEITIDKIIFPNGISNFIIKSGECINISNELLQYLKNKTTLIINNVLK